MKGYRFFIIMLALTVFCGVQAKRTAAAEAAEQEQMPENLSAAPVRQKQ